jgi:hypothetical protein
MPLQAVALPTFCSHPSLYTTKYEAQYCNTAARPPNDCFAGGWVILSYDKSDVTELAEPPDVLHGWEAGAGVVTVVEHRRLRAVRQLHMLGLTQRAATYIFLTANSEPLKRRIHDQTLDSGGE